MISTDAQVQQHHALPLHSGKALQVAPFLRARRLAERALHKSRELRHEAVSLYAGYPDFVTQREGTLARGEVPVFVFHTIDPEPFERQLSYLVDNGYRTLGLDEFARILAGRIRPRGREVLLTIDDARSSAWRYAFPLLWRYGCRATLFAIPGWTPNAREPRPNLQTVVQDARGMTMLEALDPDDATLCTWPELRVMHDSGLVDVQSHSHRHARAFVSGTVVDFLGPGSRAARFDGDASAYLLGSEWPHRESFEALHGAPLFRTRGFCAGGAYLELSRADIQPFLEQYSTLAVDGLRADWRERLARALRTRVEHLRLRVVDAETALERLVADLDLARRTLIERLGDSSAGRYFCVPFTEGSAATVTAARRVGIEGMFWGVQRGRRINTPLDDPFGIVRLKADFIFRLPGRGRLSLPDIYRAKLVRRMQGRAPY